MTEAQTPQTIIGATRTIIVKEGLGGPRELIVEAYAQNATEALKLLKSFPHGSYSIFTCNYANVTVGEPKRIARASVSVGTRFRTRTTDPNKPRKPRAPRKGNGHAKEAK